MSFGQSRFLEAPRTASLKIKLFTEVFTNTIFEYTFVCFFMHQTTICKNKRTCDREIWSVSSKGSTYCHNNYSNIVGNTMCHLNQIYLIFHNQKTPITKSTYTLSCIFIRPPCCHKIRANIFHLHKKLWYIFAMLTQCACFHLTSINFEYNLLKM